MDQVLPKEPTPKTNLYQQLYELRSQSLSPVQKEQQGELKKQGSQSEITKFILDKIKSKGEEPWSILANVRHLIQEFVQIQKSNSTQEVSFDDLYSSPGSNSSLFRVQGSVHFVHPELVFIGKGTVIEHGVMITGPCIIGKACQLRKGSYIRGNVMMGEGSVLGNSCELKNAILMDGCQIAHFNYIGDSILGVRAHFSAGAITSNYKLDGSEVKIAFKLEKKALSQEQKRGHIKMTGLNKLGALVGHHAEIGCNAILNPGSIIGRNSVVYPLVNWRGQLGSWQICKLVQQNTVVERLQKK